MSTRGLLCSSDGFRRLGLRAVGALEEFLNVLVVAVLGYAAELVNPCEEDYNAQHQDGEFCEGTVSYTHLTLPTILRV